MKGRVVIPKLELGQTLDELAGLKLEAIELLRQLEEPYAGRPVVKPGGWRHDPSGWAKRAKH